jgi:predicted dehydrogenase
MNRRQFFQTGAAGLAWSAALGAAQTGNQPRKVGLIGSGWYGKCDLFRLIQVEPVDVVALCDADQRMLAQAAELTATRQKSGKTPRKYGDYREMLRQEELDIVLIATPDHWHALPMIDAVKAGADVYVQKPISVDIVEGQAMLAAARKYNRVVQVGTQRRSTPHIIDARDRILNEGKLGKIGHVEICCYYHMRARENPPDTAPPDYLDYEMWTGPAPMRPYNELVHPRRWRAFMEYGNGIVGDMCIHMLDMVRWMMDLGWPKRVSSSGGILIDKNSKANISDTQNAAFEFDDLDVVWTHRSWGHPPDPDYPWAAIFYGEKGTLKVSVHSWDYIPLDKNEKPIHQDVEYELEQYPEDQTEERLEKHVAPAIRVHMKDFLAAIDARSKPVADIEQGFISTTSCILANMAMDLGRTLEYDPASGRVVNDEEANRLLARPYRNPWVHPEPGKV